MAANETVGLNQQRGQFQRGVPRHAGFKKAYSWKRFDYHLAKKNSIKRSTHDRPHLP